MQDVKEIVGMIMRIIDRAEITEADVLDLTFEAEGELQILLNDTYIKLLEFAHDRDQRRQNPEFDRKQRTALQHALNGIVQICDLD